jgi:hypothetical protein
MLNRRERRMKNKSKKIKPVVDSEMDEFSVNSVVGKEACRL